MMRTAKNPRNASLRARQRARRSGSAGFTMIELSVALVAGLMVSLAVVALSREATYSFHEEMRTATAEMSVRTAIDRLKSDLQRAGFMATGNVRVDPRSPLDPTGTKLGGISDQGFLDLAGIHYYEKGSLLQTPLSSVGDNAFTPDSIDITGNFTSSDSYVVGKVSPGGGGCGGQRLFLSMDSAATYRIMTSPDPNKTLQEMFQPIPGKKFLVRINDDLGRQEFVYGCATQTAGWATASGAWVDLDVSLAYLNSAYGFVDGRLTVNPVQTVRWEIRPLTSTDTTYTALATDPGNDGGTSTKYNLVRSWVGLDGVALNPAEVVAEYAVDLKFAFTFDLGAYVDTNPVPNLQSYAFGDTNNKTYAGSNVTGQPQRARSVRVRFATRGATADRNEDQRLEKNNYTIRYCLEPAGCTSGSRQWARVRTVTTEVSLPNQARFFY